jgi:NitT/TauT family transport system substrate-binding protein
MRAGLWRWLVVALALGLSGACAPPAAPPAARPTAVVSPDAAPAAAAPASPTPPLEPIRLAVAAKSLAFLPYFYGKEAGLFAEQGFDLDVSVVQPSTAVAAAIAGEVDYTGTSGSALAAAIAGAPLRLVMYVSDNLVFSLYAQPEVKTVAELAGGTVGVTNRYATDDYALAAVLQHYGVPDEQVTRVTTTTSGASLAALNSRGIIATMLSPPFSELAERQGFTFLEYAANVLRRDNSGMATRVQRIAERPDEVRRMIRATLASIRYLQDHPAEATAFVAQYFEIEPDLAVGSTEKITRALAYDGRMPVEAIDAAGEDLKRAQGLQTAARGSEFVDYRLLDEVAREPR